MGTVHCLYPVWGGGSSGQWLDRNNILMILTVMRLTEGMQLSACKLLLLLLEQDTMGPRPLQGQGPTFFVLLYSIQMCCRIRTHTNIIVMS